MADLSMSFDLWCEKLRKDQNEKDSASLDLPKGSDRHGSDSASGIYSSMSN